MFDMFLACRLRFGKDVILGTVKPAISLTKTGSRVRDSVLVVNWEGIDVSQARIRDPRKYDGTGPSLESAV